MHLLLRLGRAAAWLLAAALIAIGAAGLAVAANPPPTESSRPELFTRGDAAVAPGLAVVDGHLREMMGKVTTLSGLSRDALVALNGGDHEALVEVLDAGDLLVVEIGDQATRLAAELDALPHGADDWRLGPTTTARLDAAEQAVESVRPLADLWSRVARGALPASTIARHLAEHDQITYAATQDGVAGRYGRALERLGQARAELNGAQELRDQVAETVDTTTLDLWIERNRAYDDALARLYRALRTTPGRLTDTARRAFEEVERAEKRLPPDTRAIVVIMSDLAQGGLNQAAIRIAEARGALAAAVAAAALD